MYMLHVLALHVIELTWMWVLIKLLISWILLTTLCVAVRLVALLMTLPGLRMTERSLLLRKSVSTCTIIIYVHTCIVALTRHYLYINVFFFSFGFSLAVLFEELLYCGHSRRRRQLKLKMSSIVRYPHLRGSF